MLLTIIVGVVAAILGFGITFLLNNRKGEAIDHTSEHMEEEFEAKTSELRTRYETLLTESREKVAELDKKLALALAGKMDDLSKADKDEIEKLKKKLKGLEDEVEELEDSLDDSKKKLNSKSSENERLSASLDSANREVKHLKEDVEQLNRSLEDKIAELNLANESLSFVREILSAPEASDDSEDLFERVTNVVDFVEYDLRDAVKEIYDITAECDYVLFKYGLYSWAAKKKKSWLSGKTSIAFVGEFSAGKTSIVNRILSQDDPNVPRLPVSTKATTAIPTYITGKPKATYQFYTPDRVLKTISPETFGKVNKDVLDNIHGVSELIKYFVMGYKNPNLDNLSILDTPGFNSNDPEDAHRTIEVINECDALFWVFDVNAGTVNRSSLELIKENLTKPLYIVINKVDTKPESEVEKVEKLINSTLQQYGIDYVRIIRFSSKSPLANILGPISEIKRDEAQETYIADLKETVATWVKELNDDVLNKKRETDSLSKTIDSICDKYNNANQTLVHDCEEAAGIPQYKAGFLGFGEGYKMNTDQYNRLINTLNIICTTRVDNLCDLFNEMMKTVSEYSTSFDNHFRAKSNWQLLNDANERLIKLTNNL